MTCDDVDVLLAVRDGAPSLELAEHLRECAECRALADGTEHASDGYELGPVIAWGGMGQVRLARDLRLGRQVALKELIRADDTLAARLVREARVAAELEHPNIVPIYDIGTWADGTPYYTMRYVAGRTLFTALREATTLAERMQLLPAVIAACDAVGFAHGRGIVHRDLTPANIMLGERGETYVIDWGLAKDLRTMPVHAQPLLTVRGEVLGSPAYMPPEQAAGDVADAHADVHALGAILHHLVSGAAPYDGMTSSEILAQVRAAAPPSPVGPRGLVAIIATAMARDRAARYADASQLAAALRALQTRAVVGRPKRTWLGAAVAMFG
jgi:eukaryotic-like serine/threonine-protein kinase